MAKCEGHEVAIAEGTRLVIIRRENITDYFDPSTNWGWGGPIIEREIPMLMKTNGGEWVAQGAYDRVNDREARRYYGPTLLVAAMRCYVASKLGDTVDIPDELSLSNPSTV